MNGQALVQQAWDCRPRYSAFSVSNGSGAEQMQCYARLCVWLKVQGFPPPCALGRLPWCCRVQEGFPDRTIP